MKFRCSFVFALILLFYLDIFAQNKVGNGGDAIVCQDVNQSKVFLFDFYEENQEIHSDETDPFKIAEMQILKTQEFAPKIAIQYTQRLKLISNEIEYKDNVELTNIEDSKEFYLPIDKKCKLEQVAIRKNHIHGLEKRFIFRQDLWSQLAPEHQAGLLLHEIIYEHLSKLGETDSIKARKINRFLFQDKINQKDFWLLIKDLKLPIYP